MASQLVKDKNRKIAPHCQICPFPLRGQFEEVIQAHIPYFSIMQNIWQVFYKINFSLRIRVTMICIMRNVSRIRLQNLESLIKEAGSAAGLARAANTNSSYLSQVRNRFPAPNGNPRGIGNELADKLEKAMGKPSGWMDLQHEKATSIDGIISAHAPFERKLLPLISWVQAGNWQEISEGLVSEWNPDLLACPIRCSPDSFVLQVRGASMEPRFNEGDLIYVDPNMSPDHGRYVVVRLTDSNEATFKQLVIEGGKQYLKAINPDWPQRIIEVHEEAVICGVIFFKGEVV